MISPNLLRFVPRAARSAALRRQAVSATRHELSARLLGRFPHLVRHPGTSGNADVHYQDAEFGGAVCCTASEAMLMYHAARLCQPQHALEIGSYVGWSSAHIASALDGAALTCVEPFVETAAGADPAAARFAENIASAGLQQRIRLVRDKSPDALPSLSAGRRWDFVFVDGWHLNGQPLRDVAGVLPLLSDNAVLLLHDLWIADVRDALLHLVAGGWSYHLFDTANYLALLWRDAPPWLDELRRIGAQPEFTLPEAAARRFLFGLGADSIEAARCARGAAP